MKGKGRIGRGRPRIGRACGGFSLPELMVTLVVSGLLVTGIASGYLAHKSGYENEAQFIDMQMNARLAMDEIAEIVRNAGIGAKNNFPPAENETLYGAFRSAAQVFTAIDRNDGPDELTVVTGLRARTRVESVLSDRVVLADVLNHNDLPMFDTDRKRYLFFSPQGENRFLEILTLNEMSREVTLSDPCTNPDDEFCPVKEGDEVYRVNAYTITLDRNGNEYLDVDGDGSVEDRDLDTVPDLYLYNNISDLIKDNEEAGVGQASVSSAEVAEGIEDLQFRFGWDANEDGTIQEAEFVDDPTGSEDKVRAVRVYLMARSASSDPRFEDSTPAYSVANHVLTLDTDSKHYHRMLLVETVMIRNLNL